jgi:hypothetical protein
MSLNCLPIQDPEDVPFFPRLEAGWLGNKWAHTSIVASDGEKKRPSISTQGTLAINSSAEI